MIDIQKGSANVYADLGYQDAGEMFLKAQIMTGIREIIQSRHLTILEAADVLGMAELELFSVLRGRFRVVSEARLIDCLARLG